MAQHQAAQHQPVTGSVVFAGVGDGAAPTEDEALGSALAELDDELPPDPVQVEVGDGEAVAVGVPVALVVGLADADAVELADGEAVALADGEVLEVASGAAMTCDEAVEVADGDADALAEAEAEELADALAEAEAEAEALADEEALAVADGVGVGEQLSVGDGDRVAAAGSELDRNELGTGVSEPVGSTEPGNAEGEPVAQAHEFGVVDGDGDADGVAAPACAGQVLASSRNWACGLPSCVTTTAEASVSCAPGREPA